MKYWKLLFIYLIGCIVAYSYARYSIQKYDHKYSVRDRIACMIISTGSWGTVFVTGIFNLLQDINTQEPANW